ncbi:MAG TPA: hypothetical protein VFU81_22405, partial [Thermomicrobiales bacterium]|nr:hypothetical protein [Thermomicrobiales bacterium]
RPSRPTSAATGASLLAFLIRSGRSPFRRDESRPQLGQSKPLTPVYSEVAAMRRPSSNERTAERNQ